MSKKFASGFKTKSRMFWKEMKCLTIEAQRVLAPVYEVVHRTVLDGSIRDSSECL